MIALWPRPGLDDLRLFDRLEEEEADAAEVEERAAPSTTCVARDVDAAAAAALDLALLEAGSDEDDIRLVFLSVSEWHASLDVGHKAVGA